MILGTDLGTPVCQSLSDVGHALDVPENPFLPRLFASPTGILVGGATGRLHGGADPYHRGVDVGLLMPGFAAQMIQPYSRKDVVNHAKSDVVDL
jgi:hypothetical protein